MNIDFDQELSRGVAAYDDSLARWWLARASDPAHRRAYRRIADFIAFAFPRAPRRIADYGCGPGHLLAALRRRFPRSDLAGYDASGPLIEAARRRLAGVQGSGRVRLVKTLLPGFDLPRARADLVLVAFPNFVPRSPEKDLRAHERGLSAPQRKIARWLAR